MIETGSVLKRLFARSNPALLFPDFALSSPRFTTRVRLWFRFSWNGTTPGRKRSIKRANESKRSFQSRSRIDRVFFKANFTPRTKSRKRLETLHKRTNTPIFTPFELSFIGKYPRARSDPFLASFLFNIDNNFQALSPPLNRAKRDIVSREEERVMVSLLVSPLSLDRSRYRWWSETLVSTLVDGR